MFFFIVFVIVTGIIVFYARRFLGRKESFAKFLAENEDFNPDYTYHTVMAVDTKSRRLIVSQHRSDYRLIHASKINSLQKNSEGTGVRRQFQILFVLHDFENPQVRMPFANMADRDLWYDRLMML